MGGFVECGAGGPAELEFALEDVAVLQDAVKAGHQDRWRPPRAVGEARESGGIGGRELPYGVKI
jgi:hypothetical protein